MLDIKKTIICIKRYIILMYMNFIDLVVMLLPLKTFVSFPTLIKAKIHASSYTLILTI